MLRKNSKNFLFLVVFIIVFLIFFQKISYADTPLPKILIVADAHSINADNSLLLPVYENVLDRLGYKYDYCLVSKGTDDGPKYNGEKVSTEGEACSNVGMKNYDIVIWFTGEDSNLPTAGGNVPLTRDDISNITQYLNNGGHLLLIGDGIATELSAYNSTFLNNYLNAYLCSTNYTSYYIKYLYGTNNSAVFDYYSKILPSPVLSNSSISEIYYPVVFPMNSLSSLNRGGRGRNSYYYRDYYPNKFNYSLSFYNSSNNYYYCDNTNTYIIENYYSSIPIFSSTVYKNSINNGTAIFLSFLFSKISGNNNRTEYMKRLLGFLGYPLSIDSGIFPNMTCDPYDKYCIRKKYPILEGYCQSRVDPQGRSENVTTVNISKVYYSVDNGNFKLTNISQTAKIIDGYFSWHYNATINVSDIPNGTNYVFILCEDNRSVFSKYPDKIKFFVDREPPYYPNFTVSPLYTNNGNITLKFNLTSIYNYTDFLPYSFSLTCNLSSNKWSRWIKFNTTSNITIYSFNISSIPECNYSIQGKKTIYVRVVDKAGNVNLTYKNFTVVLDYTPPRIISITPINNSIIKKTKPFKIIFADKYSGVIESFYKVIYLNFLWWSSSQISNLNNNTVFYPFNLFNIADSSGDKLIVTLKDKAGNKITYVFYYTIDDTPPTISGKVSPAYYSFTYVVFSNRSNIFIDASDSHLNKTLIITLNNTKNITVQNDQPFTINTSSSGPYDIKVYAFDTAGNIAYKDYSNLFLDNQPPNITAGYKNNSVINTNFNNLSFNITDLPNVANSLINSTSLLINNGTLNSSLIDFSNGDPYIDDHYSQIDSWIVVYYNISYEIINPYYVPSSFLLYIINNYNSFSFDFDPFWNDEGWHNLTIFVKDRLNNLAIKRYRYLVDLTPPNTTDNYTLTSWQKNNQEINLSCSDNVSWCSRTYYCIYSPLNETSCVPENIYTKPIIVNCLGNSVCEFVIRYYSVDAAGNKEKIKESSYIKIDKSPPSVSFKSPLNSSVDSGTIPIIADVNDSGSGIKNVNYTIIFVPNKTVIVKGYLKEGSNNPNEWVAYWNSLANISTNAPLTNVSIILEAIDNVGNKKITTSNISIDNELPSTNIYSPISLITNKNYINLTLKAEESSSAASFTLIWFNITSPNGTSVLKYVNNSISSTSYFNSTLINTSLWPSTNYTLTFETEDNLSHVSSASSWFYIDRLKPNITILYPKNSSLFAGIISIYAKETDNIGIKNCSLSYHTLGEWSPIYSVLCNSNITFDTSSCNDSSKPDCIIRIYSYDIAGNINESDVFIQVDNSPPLTTLISPHVDSWHNSNFDLKVYISEPQLDFNNVCLYKINDSPWFKGYCKNENITDFLINSSYCRVEGKDSCSFKLNVSNLAGKWKIYEYNFSMDYTPPIITSNFKTPFIFSNQTKLLINAFDNLSGASQILIITLNNTKNITVQNDQPFTINTSSSGPYDIKVYAFDTAGNIAYKDYSNLFLDNQPPKLINYTLSIKKDKNFGDYRILFNDSFKITSYVTDNSNTSYLILYLQKPDGNIIKLVGIRLKQNYTLFNSTSEWLINIPSSIFNEYGKYKIISLQLNDSFNNFVNKTINLTIIVPIQHLRISFGNISNKEINAGNISVIQINDYFNITLFNGSLIINLPNTSVYGTDAWVNYNITSLKCLEKNCTVSFIKNPYGEITQINVSFKNYDGIYVNLTGYVKAHDPGNNTLGVWSAYYDNRWFGKDFTWVLCPFLILNATTSPGYQNKTFIFNQSETFTFYGRIFNKEDYSHNGTAYNINVSLLVLNNTQYNKTNSSPLLFGAISPNSTVTTTWNLSFANPGDYLLSFIVFNNLTKKKHIFKKLVVIRDSLPPEVKKYYLYNLKTRYYVGQQIKFVSWLQDNVAVSKTIIYVKYPDGSVHAYSGKLDTLTGTAQYGIWYYIITNTSEEGNYTIFKIFANDTSGNFVNKTVNLTFETSVLRLIVYTNENNTNALSNITIYAKIYGNATPIYQVKTNIVMPYGYSKTIYLQPLESLNNTYLFSSFFNNTTESGVYLVNSSILLGTQSLWNKTTFNILYGNLSVLFMNSNSKYIYIPLTAKYFSLIWKLVPIGGDTRNVSCNLSINDTSKIYLLPGEKSNLSIGLVKYFANNTLIKWNFTINQSSGTGIVEININVSYKDSEGIFRKIIKKITLNLIPSDNIPPKINSFYVSDNKTNLNEKVLIRINATDNTLINNTVLEVTYPNGTYVKNVTLHLFAPQIYTVEFKDFNITGNYTLIVFVFDLGNNYVRSEPKYVNATNVYHVEIQPNGVYFNKGMFIQGDILVYDVNNRPVNNFFINVFLSENNLINKTIVSNKQSNTFYYVPIYSDLPLNTKNSSFTTYIFRINVSKDGNKGNAKMIAFVTNKLTFDMEEPKDNGDYPNTIPVKVKVYNIKNEPVSDAIVSVFCTKACTNKNTLNPYANLYPDGIPGEYVNLKSLAPLSGFNESSIDVVGYDPRANYGITEKIVKTTPQYSSPLLKRLFGGGGTTTPSGKNGGGFGYFPPMQKLENNMPSFSMETVEDILIISQGSNITLGLKLKNNLNRTLVIKLKDEQLPEKFGIIRIPNQVKINANSTKTINLLVIVPLTTNASRYYLKIIASYGKEKMSKVVPVVIEENDEVIKYESLLQTYQKLKRYVDELRKKGINVDKYEKEIDKLHELLEKAQKCMKNNDVRCLSKYNEKASEMTGNIERDLMSLKVKLFFYEHKKLIFFMIIFSILFGILMTEIIIPLMSINSDIKKLKEEEKNLINARKNAEKQYFKREIDEVTFRKIISSEQEKILKIKAKIRELEEEKELIKKCKILEVRKKRKERAEEKKKLKKLKRMFERKATMQRFMKDGRTEIEQKSREKFEWDHKTRSVVFKEKIGVEEKIRSIINSIKDKIKLKKNKEEELTLEELERMIKELEKKVEEEN